MAVPVLVDEVFRGRLPDGSEPLGAPRTHPDEITGGNRIPRVAQTVNAASFEHQQAVLHHVHFDYAQRGARLVYHGVHREIEVHRVWKQAPYLQVWVVVKRVWRNGFFRGDQRARRFKRSRRLVRLLDNGGDARFFRYYAMWQAFGKVGIPTRVERIPPAADLHLELAFEDKQKTLRSCAPELAAGLKFGCVLHEFRPYRRACVNDSRAPSHAGQRRTDKSVGGQKQVILFLSASCLTEIMHGTSSFGIPTKRQVGRAGAVRTRVRFPHPPTKRPRRDRD